jgi:hypothetical protein
LQGLEGFESFLKGCKGFTAKGFRYRLCERGPPLQNDDGWVVLGEVSVVWIVFI